MELYEENENIISSDEYSDDDALMNDAVTSQNHYRSCNYNDLKKLPKWRIDHKQKELSSLIRRHKISVIYKNKAIKWLNNKRQRERYKERIAINAEDGVIKRNSTNIVSSDIKNKYGVCKYNTGSNYDLISYKAKDKKIIDAKSNIGNVAPVSTEVTNSEKENDEKKVDEKIALIERNSNDIEKLKTFSAKGDIILGKRTRTSSSPVLKEYAESVTHSDKKFRAESTNFYKSVNDMFPKCDKINISHIDSIANSLLPVLEDKMKTLSNEINTLNEVLQAKEMEWKRLTNLKMVKEDILSRLKKKKYIFQLKENFSSKKNQNILLELKELECYLTENKESEETSSSITIKKLIENRANMNADDLKREKNNTSRLHSLLVSQNMLHAAETTENHYTISKSGKKDLESTKKKSEVCNQFKGGITNRATTVDNRDWQGEVKDVEDLILDFRQKNLKLMTLVGNHKLTEATAPRLDYSIPEHADISCSHLFVRSHHSDLFPFPNSIEEISITPVGCSKKLSSYDSASRNNHDSRLDDTFLKRQTQKQFNDKCTKIFKNPLCQECKIKESRFVCAGCGNQWYCSKKCQIAAWDKHSELCTE